MAAWEKWQKGGQKTIRHMRVEWAKRGNQFSMYYVKGNFSSHPTGSLESKDYGSDLKN